MSGSYTTISASLETLGAGLTTISSPVYRVVSGTLNGATEGPHISAVYAPSGLGITLVNDSTIGQSGTPAIVFPGINALVPPPVAFDGVYIPGSANTLQNNGSILANIVLFGSSTYSHEVIGDLGIPAGIYTFVDEFLTGADGLAIGGGTVFNAASGLIAGTEAGIALQGNGSIDNQGSIAGLLTPQASLTDESSTGVGSFPQSFVAGGYYGNGISANGASGVAVAITNSGTITGGNGIEVYGAQYGNSGTIINLAGGLIEGRNPLSPVVYRFPHNEYFAAIRQMGIDVPPLGDTSSAYGNLTVFNAGTIIGSPSLTGNRGSGIMLTQGVITNAAQGLIASDSWYAIGQDTFGQVTLINEGTISAQGGNGGFQEAVKFHTGTIINSGTISEQASYGNAIVFGASGTVVNSGIISEQGDGSRGVIYTYDGGIEPGTDGSGIVFTAGGTVINAGTIKANEGVDSIDFGAGAARLVLDPGSTFTGTVRADSSFSTVLELRHGGPGSLGTNPLLNQAIYGFNTIQFDVSSSWTLAGNLAELANGQTITGFAAGATILLENFAETNASFVTGTGLVIDSGNAGATLDLTGYTAADHFNVSTDGTNTTITAPCYAKGTRIAAKFGNLPIERLKPGDLVKTMDNGWQPIQWIGTRSYDGRFIADNHLALPIRIRRHAIAFNVPSRDLIVSPDHGICIENILIPAWRLLNGVSITQAETVEQIHYFHLELEHHGIIFAENCPAESFLDADCRHRFQNAGSFADPCPPQTSCLPRIEHGFQLDSIRRRLATRAGLQLPSAPHGKLHGHIDIAGPEIIAGWAQNEHPADEPVCMYIFARGHLVARVLANRFRSDLRAAGIGSGCHAFELALPPGASGPFAALRSQDGAALPLTQAAMAA